MKQYGTLTIKDLESKFACHSQRQIFMLYFPKGFYPSKENFHRAALVGLNIGWAISRFVQDEFVKRRIYIVTDQAYWTRSKLDNRTQMEILGSVWLRAIEEGWKS